MILLLKRIEFKSENVSRSSLSVSSMEKWKALFVVVGGRVWWEEFRNAWIWEWLSGLLTFNRFAFLKHG